MKYLRNIKSLTLIIILLMLSACASSGTALLNSLAKTNDYTKTLNIAYGIQRQNKLDIYTPSPPSSKNQKNAVVVFFYGGCWGECTSLKKSDYLFVAQSLASKGYTIVIADYRQYPEVNFEGLMSDASSVLRWVSRHVSQYGGDPERIIVAGHSSGAHIASMLALNPRYLNNDLRKKIRGFVGLAGPYDFLPLDEAYQKVLFDSSSNYASSQPINFLSVSSPPLLILHGEEDTTVGLHNAVNLSKKAKRLGLKQKLIIYPTHDHVSILTALSRPLKARSTVFRDMLTFIKNQTDKPL